MSKEEIDAELKAIMQKSRESFDQKRADAAKITDNTDKCASPI